MTRDLTTLFLAAAIKKRLEPLQAPIVAQGSAVLFDYRVLHRGLANTSSVIRPILVYTFAKPWYKDVLNFPRCSIFDEVVLREEEGEEKENEKKKIDEGESTKEAGEPDA